MPTQTNTNEVKVLPPPASFRVVQSDEVVGRKLIQIRQLWSMRPDEGFDYAWSYLLLDSGLVIALRFECVVAEPIPTTAELIEHQFLSNVYGQTIASAYLATEDCAWVDDHQPYLRFNSGWAISDVPVAPHGVGGVGIMFFEPGELDFGQFRQLW